jgi:hypothetical protein
MILASARMRGIQPLDVHHNTILNIIININHGVIIFMTNYGLYIEL